MGRARDDEDLKKMLDALFELLIKKGVLGPEARQNKTQVIDTVMGQMKENGMELTTQKMSDPKFLKQVCAGLVVAAIAPPGEGMKQTLGLIFSEPALTPQQTLRLQVGVELIKSMQKYPELRPSLDLLHKKDRTPEEEKELTGALTKVVEGMNKELGLKLTTDQIDSIVNQIKKDADTEMVKDAVKAVDPKVAPKTGAANVVMLSNGDPMGFVVNYPIPTGGMPSPLEDLEGAILFRDQEATGEFALEENSMLSMGEDIVDDFGDALSLDDIDLDLGEEKGYETTEVDTDGKDAEEKAKAKKDKEDEEKEDEDKKKDKKETKGGGGGGGFKDEDDLKSSATSAIADAGVRMHDAPRPTGPGGAGGSAGGGGKG